MTDFAELDDAAIEQLLAGEIAAVDAPDGWAPVALLLRAAADVEPGDDPSPELLEAMVAAADQGWSRSDGGGVVARRRIGVAVGVAAMFLGAGTAAAAAGGHLPDPVQSVVHDVVGAVGIDVPDVDEVEVDEVEVEDVDGGESGPPSTAGSQDGEGNGRSDEAPGRPESPGNSENAPGQDGTTGRPESPGNSENAPGQDGTTGRPESPGNSENAPGQDGTTGRPADPGQPGLPPGQANRTTTTTTAAPATTAPVEDDSGNGNGNAGGNGNGNAGGNGNGNAGGNGNGNAGGNGNGNGN